MGALERSGNILIVVNEARGRIRFLTWLWLQRLADIRTARRCEFVPAKGFVASETRVTRCLAALRPGRKSGRRKPIT